MTLPWFPPAPAAGPASLLQLPPDDWALEPKIDGIRVIILGGEPFTRQGRPLSPDKGAAALRQLVAGVAETLDGEWMPKERTFYLFDLPEHGGTYDERRQAIWDLAEQHRLHFVESSDENFPQMYASYRAAGAEGIVLKRRASLYTRQPREGVETRDWLKRRFAWD